MTDDEFTAKLRDDARALQYAPHDDRAYARIAERVQERIAQPSVADVLASWFRPLVASLVAAAIVVVVAFSVTDTEPAPGVGISIAGEAYSVE